MAFFTHNFHQHNSDASFTPLFRLLEDFNNYSRDDQTGRRSGLAQWQPKFDIRETGDAYELHGEFPGMSKENVHIEFTEPQTMTIRGRTERTYTANTPPAALLGARTASDAAIEDAEKDTNSHKATVEDENEASTDEKSPEQTLQVEKKQEEKTAAVDKAKYWLTERSIGEFSRSFTFPTRVEHDEVSANFKDGVLSITVPKAKKHESRRIAVN